LPGSRDDVSTTLRAWDTFPVRIEVR
jgi:hypothetical protein